PSLENYQGSVFEHQGIEILFIRPLELFHSVKYYPFVTRRFISKVVNPNTWREPTEFKWCVGTPENLQEIFYEFNSAIAISCDIETFKQNLVIRCMGFTAIFDSSGKLTTSTVVIPCSSDFEYTWIKKFCEELTAPKI